MARKRSSLATSSLDLSDVILTVRGQKVILDADLATVYGVTTKRLNEQVKRNPARFPDDFMFQLTGQERSGVVANCDHLARLRFHVKEDAVPYKVRPTRKRANR